MDGVESWSRTVTTEKCLAELIEHGVPCSAYRTVAEAMHDPQIAHRGALAEVEDGGGTFKVMNMPFRMSDARVAAGKRAPALGEHTRDLLGESRIFRGCRSQPSPASRVGLSINRLAGPAVSGLSRPSKQYPGVKR